MAAGESGVDDDHRLAFFSVRFVEESTFEQHDAHGAEIIGSNHLVANLAYIIFEGASFNRRAAGPIRSLQRGHTRGSDRDDTGQASDALFGLLEKSLRLSAFRIFRFRKRD